MNKCLYDEKAKEEIDGFYLACEKADQKQEQRLMEEGFECFKAEYGEALAEQAPQEWRDFYVKGFAHGRQKALGGV